MHAANSKPEIAAFMQTQFAFAGAIRDPANAAVPKDVEPRRMAVYQELFYNNIEEFLSNAFPVLRKITPDEKWHALMREFLIEHRATTPLFPEMPREFLHYLEQGRAPREDDLPFMLELAHYEWAELALSISEEVIDEECVEHNSSLLTGIPVLSPLIWLCSYRYPVHCIGPDFIPQQPTDEATHLLVYRDRKDRVGFMELNPVTAQLLHSLQQNHDKSGEHLLRGMAQAMQHPNPDTVLSGGLEILQELHSRDIILGSRK
ncbi:MAG: putative DNA-binding domain-containing protein [Gammaproteobacteria bacterium]|nr:putative DNA-binding domain-containing protein [Gammaproteobacteria bacterium]